MNERTLSIKCTTYKMEYLQIVYLIMISYPKYIKNSELIKRENNPIQKWAALAGLAVDRVSACGLKILGSSLFFSFDRKTVHNHG